MKRLFCSFLIALTAAVLSPAGSLAAESETKASISAPININTANAQKLTELKGVGESKAQAIIAWRDKNGPFKKIEQLLEVNGVGQATLDNIRKNIVL
ncbi:ComEA family DNA-binding protein [Gilvimarinus polysaccharolyticus]|uniref:ComEA family DNA-binding protein n=1 Tax=Gilvimarinus polysaccharolyticus TaxID=863921 RepID=UPI000673A2E5|nr:helix-hairpin-helix domain-containing protein [Gilvimarinus polysaccharolyticus]